MFWNCACCALYAFTARMNRSFSPAAVVSPQKNTGTVFVKNLRTGFGMNLTLVQGL